jgi:hypothetical protein
LDDAEVDMNTTGTTHRTDPATAAREAITNAGLRIGTRRDDGGRNGRDIAYVGVLRRGSRIVVECGHRHTNRDASTRTGGTSASDCIRELARAALRPNFLEHQAQQIATAWTRLGPHVTTTTREKARADAPANVAAYRALVAKVATLIGGDAA